MKYFAESSVKGNERKSFLVLPSIDEKYKKMPGKKPDLKLLIKSFKNNEENVEHTRPLTATLDKPTILDIRFIRKIDMSKIRKEFLNISNLCKIPTLINNNKKTALRRRRPLSLPPPEKQKIHAKNRKNCWEQHQQQQHEENAVKTPKKKSKSSKSNTSILDNHSRKSLDNNNNNNKVAGKCGAPNAKIEAINNKNNSNNNRIKSTKHSSVIIMPEPCKTCGRPDQPERFHSHPTTTVMANVTVKATVQKPIPIKYKAKDPKKALVSLDKPSPTTNPIKEPTKPRLGSGKRTLTCYLCGREFGSASLPLHEPKCLQKWERENAKLPLEMRRKAPRRPDLTKGENRQEFNDLAWESFQSTLVPCKNCARTFHPDRLMVHQRSCKTNKPRNTLNVPMSNVSPPSSPTSSKPPTYKCYMCGKMFGSNSIKVHEKQCLKKWNSENDSTTNSTPSPTFKEHSRPLSSRKPALLPCYLCGKLFTINSMPIHEPQCLKMWKVENEKLPIEKRRKEPPKPIIHLTNEGKVNLEATNESMWQIHLSQLVPCKICSRTFNPDRVEIHERSCKGF